MLEPAHKRVNLMEDILCGIWKISRMHGELQRVVEVFIRIVFRGIRRQEKHLHFLAVFLQPSLDKFAMMNLQIIQNQEHFPLRRADQALHKLDQPPLVHSIPIDHEPHMALAADCREHIDPFPLCFHRQNRWPALGSETSFHRLTIAHPGFVPPINCSAFLCRALQNCGSFLGFPPLDTLRILLPGALRWALAAQSPALHIL